MTIERSSEPGEFYIAQGVGPHPDPWPTSQDFDPELLSNGDRRNIIDKFRYRTVDSIRKELDESRINCEIAIENWQHDLNIGSLIRTANAFNVSRFHIIGNKRFNKHGALMTDKYLTLEHHATAHDFATAVRERGRVIVGCEQLTESVELVTFRFPENSVIVLGNEGLGLTQEMIAVLDCSFFIPQSGSVRSMNASAAGAIALYAWLAQNHSTTEGKHER